MDAQKLCVFCGHVEIVFIIEELGIGDEVTDKPNLGLATTEELFSEIIARFTTWSPNNDAIQLKMTKKAIILAEMLGSLSTVEREYKTIDTD